LALLHEPLGARNALLNRGGRVVALHLLLAHTAHVVCQQLSGAQQ
jgi:hypothetical protein